MEINQIEETSKTEVNLNMTIRRPPDTERGNVFMRYLHKCRSGVTKWLIISIGWVNKQLP